MRFVVARRCGKRGAGLGNEMLAWSKGFLASKVLGAHLIGPSWGLNKRAYYRHFRTSRFDFLWEDILTRIPHYRFSEQDYVNSGQVDFGKAIEIWATQKGLLKKASYIVSVDGMYGGYPSISEARPFLWAKLLTSQGALDNIYKISSQLDSRKLFVAVHMRFGDFSRLREGESIRGRFNIRVPMAWYLRVCEALRLAFEERVQFYFFTDTGGPEFDQAVLQYNPGQIRQAGLCECSDLALMAQADLRICSVSSYSLVASFLGQGMYAWYEPQLTYERGNYTLWGSEAMQQLVGSLTARALEEIQQIVPGSDHQEMLKGYPVRDDGVIPIGLIAQLRHKLQTKDPAANLLEYGVVPDWVMER